ncbi:MAG: radical SAM family heme chaperone HemW [Acidobacteria bacterium]|nr:radical SAM family heme chaperone HemW [Acidobacteriota bacterium]
MDRKGRYLPAQMSESLAVNLGLYIHIPFCQAKCSYCHFISVPYQQRIAARYKSAILREIANTCIHNAVNVEVDTIYFGGGTPSLVPAGHLISILSACRSRFHLIPECEISLEVNPGTLSEKKIKSFRKAGVNRISIGAQSFVDQELRAIGRLHTADMILDTVYLLRNSGYENISLDLMLGLPFQTKESWHKSLNIFIQLRIPHISIYMLDLDEECLLSKWVAANLISIPEEDLISDMYLETINTLASAGYTQYEISNFSLPGSECCHNLKYWRREAVHGFGLGSHSFDGMVRYSNLSNMKDYLGAIETDTSPKAWEEPIDARKALQESLFLGLRLAHGINLDELSNKYDEKKISQYAGHFQELSERGLVKRDGNRFSLTTSGMLLSNEIFQLFV